MGRKEYAQATGSFIDITKAVTKDGFPNYHEQQLKGKGYFDYSVKEFSFKVIKEVFNNVTLPLRNNANTTGNEYTYEGKTLVTEGELRAMRHDPVIIREKGGEILTRGFIDEIKKWNNTTCEFKIYPDAVRLKDVMAGEEITDDDGDDPFHILKTDGAENIRDIIQSMCTHLNAKLLDKGLSMPFSVNQGSAPDPQDGGVGTNKTWLGSVLQRRGANGFSWNLAKMFINAFDGSFIRRKTNSGEPSGYDYYFEERDASIIKRILIAKGDWLSIDRGQWMSFNFHIPSGMHLSTLHVSFDIPTSISFTNATFDLYYPNGFTWSPFNISFRYPCGLSATFWSISIDMCTFNIHVGDILPSVQMGNFTVDLGDIQPRIGWSSVHWNLGTIVPTLEWADTSFHIPNGEINIPANHFKIPCIGSYHQIYKLEAGGVEFDEGYVRSIFPLTDSNYFISGLDNEEDDEGMVSSLNTTYGGRYDNSGASSNVPLSKLKAFIENDENAEIIYNRVAVDYDNANTYFVTKTNRGTAGEDWLISLETPFDFTQKVNYKNKKCNEVMKQLSIITNRYFYVDKDNVIHLKPRNDEVYNTQRNIERRLFLTRDVNVKPNQEVEIKVDVLKQDSAGKVSQYGVYMRESEFEYLKKFYGDLFSGDVITNEIEIVRPTDVGLNTDFNYPELMDMIYMTTDGVEHKLGVCIQVSNGTESSKSKYVAQFIREGNA